MQRTVDDKMHAPLGSLRAHHERGSGIRRKLSDEPADRVFQEGPSIFLRTAASKKARGTVLAESDERSVTLAST